MYPVAVLPLYFAAAWIGDEAEIYSSEKEIRLRSYLARKARDLPDPRALEGKTQNRHTLVKAGPIGSSKASLV